MRSKVHQVKMHVGKIQPIGTGQTWVYPLSITRLVIFQIYLWDRRHLLKSSRGKGKYKKLRQWRLWLQPTINYESICRKEIPFSLLIAIVLAFLANDPLIDKQNQSVLLRSDGLILLSFIKKITKTAEKQNFSFLIFLL